MPTGKRKIDLKYPRHAIAEKMLDLLPLWQPIIGMISMVVARYEG
jgi:hypothetical protein